MQFIVTVFYRFDSTVTKILDHADALEMFNVCVRNNVPVTIEAVPAK